MTAAKSSTNSSITVASYNIRRCVGLDFRPRAERIASVVRELDADVIGLQEVGFFYERGVIVDQLAHIANSTGMTPIAGYVFTRPPGLYGNALLTRLSVREVRHWDLSVPGCEPRGALDVELEYGGQAIRVVTTHLGTSARERRTQVSKLLAHLGPMSLRVTLLLGDFNEWLPLRRRSCVRQISARMGPCKSVRTWPAPAPIVSLDRIWVHPQQAIRSRRAHRSWTARIASDHLPVWARVEWQSANDHG